MKNRIGAMLVLAAVALLVGGATGAAQSPNAQSPNAQSPNGQSPAVAVAAADVAPAAEGVRWAHGGDLGVQGSSADPDPGGFTIDSGSPGGYAEWTNDGDTLKACDIEDTPEGTWHARAYIYVPDRPNSGTGQVLMAISDLSDNASCTAFHSDISETVNKEMKVCVTNADGAVINSTCNWTLNLP